MLDGCAAFASVLSIRGLDCNDDPNPLAELVLSLSDLGAPKEKPSNLAGELLNANAGGGVNPLLFFGGPPPF